MKWYKLLRLRNPKWKREWRYKILLSLVLTLVIVHAIRAFPSGSGDALGTYTPATDEIWVDNTLDADTYDRVMTHELAHRDFYYTFPFWMYLKVSLIYLVIFFAFMGLLTTKKRFFYLVGLSMLVCGIHETYAYGWTMVVHGIGVHSLSGLFAYGIIPIIVIVAIHVMNFKPKKTIDIAYKITVSRFGTKKLRRKVDILELARMSIFAASGFLLACWIFEILDLAVLVALGWALVLFMWAVGREIEKMGIGRCRFTRVRKTRGRPKKVDKK